MPGRRQVGLGADDDHEREEGLDCETSFFCCWVEPAKVADAVKSGRQDMLKIAAHELIGLERALAMGPRFGVGVGEVDELRIGFDNTVVTDRGAANISGEITYDRFAGTGGLGMDPPTLTPNRVRDLGVKVRSVCAQRFLHPLAHGSGECLAGQQPVGLTKALPLLAIESERSARNDIVDMRMKLQLASPSMQYSDHAEFAAQVIRSCGDRLKGGRTLRKEQIV
jgi:hypothetical protein